MTSELINSLNIKKFTQFLTKIIDKYPVDKKEVFNADELSKLQSIFEISETDLDEIIVFILECLSNSCFHMYNPSELSAKLENDEINAEKCEVIVTLWERQAKELVDRCRGRNLAAQELLDVNWRLGLTIGHSSKSFVKEPIANIEFTVRNNNKNGVIENHGIEFNHEELTQFYQTLENIQKEIDSMSK